MAIDTYKVLSKQAADFLDPPNNQYINDPVAWIEDHLGPIWSMQADIADSVCDNRHTAVKSCHGPGKSYIAAGLVAWWLDVHQVGEAFAVTTAPTQTQIEAILWREIGRHHRKANLDGYITGGNQPQWKLKSGELIGFGRKPADYIDVEQAKAAFQGIHSRYVLVVIDEAAGIPAWLWDAVESLLTNEHARVLAIGNPDDPASQFAKVCSPGGGWKVFTIDAFSTPNFTGEEIPPAMKDLLVSPIWVEERRKRWGEGSPLWESRVRGEFPKTATDTLISPYLILQAQRRDLSDTAAGDHGRYGVDVARSGNDESTIYFKQGNVYRLEFAKIGIGDTMQLAGEVRRRIAPHMGLVPAVIDIIGIGAGVYDRLNEQSLNVVPFQSSEKAIQVNSDGSAKYANKRAEQFWHLRELFHNGLIDIDEDDEELANQLGSMKWKIDSSGRIVIESKEDMKKRGLPSPDRADALMMVTVDVAGTQETGTLNVRHTQSLTSDLMGIQW